MIAVDRGEIVGRDRISAVSRQALDVLEHIRSELMDCVEQRRRNIVRIDLISRQQERRGSFLNVGNVGVELEPLIEGCEGVLSRGSGSPTRSMHEPSVVLGDEKRRKAERAAVDLESLL